MQRNNFPQKQVPCDTPETGDLAPELPWNAA